MSTDPYQPGGHDQDVSDLSPLYARRLSFALAEDDNVEPEPKVDLPQVAPEDVLSSISHANAKKRVARLMTRRANGSFKVPEEIARAWQDGDQDRLVSEFMQAGLDKDIFLGRTKDVETFQLSSLWVFVGLQPNQNIWRKLNPTWETSCWISWRPKNVVHVVIPTIIPQNPFLTDTLVKCCHVSISGALKLNK